jgi:hypothetical protein
MLISFLPYTFRSLSMSYNGFDHILKLRKKKNKNSSNDTRYAMYWLKGLQLAVTKLGVEYN